MKNLGVFMMMVFAAVIALMTVLICRSHAAPAGGTHKPVYFIAFDAGSTNITTGAYVELDSALDASCSELVVFNSLSEAVKLAIGASGNESDIPYAFGNDGGVAYKVYMPLKKGVRLSARAISGNATTGYLIINCLQ